MAELRRLLLVRHGETVGESSIRLQGSTDVALAEEGRAQARAAARALRNEPIDLVVASPLQRSWESAWIVGRGRLVRIESGFREIHFGRWEGLTKEEAEAQDPIAYADWQSRAAGFEYPHGESRAEFNARVKKGLQCLLAARAHSALVVVHKGVIRAIVRELTGEVLDGETPALGERIVLTRGADGSWFRGRRSSNPPALDEGGCG